MDCTGEQHFQQQENCCSRNITWINPFNLCFLLLLLMISFAQLVVSAALPASPPWLFYCSLKLKITVCVKLKTEVELLPEATGWYMMRVVISRFGNLNCFFPGWSLQLLPWVALHAGELGCLLPHRLCTSWLCPVYSWSAMCRAPQSLLTHSHFCHWKDARVCLLKQKLWKWTKLQKENTVYLSR